MFRSTLAISVINNGALQGIKCMPQKDSTSDNTSSFSMGRNVFHNTYNNNNITNQQQNQKKWIGGNRDASSITEKYRNNQIGTGSLNANGNLMGFTTYKDINVVDNALRRVRSGGSVPPPKKANSPNKIYAPSPSFRPMTQNMKKIYGIKTPTLYH
jgi:hypothetical protein